MTHDELLAYINKEIDQAAWVQEYYPVKTLQALRAVVELHKPSKIPDWVPTKNKLMCGCAHVYPCPTIQAIEKELE
jgi:hypothetical protein